MNTRCITPASEEWSDALNQLGEPLAPTKLFAVGRPLPEKEKAIAVVGTRWPTAAGIEIAREIAGGLAEADFCVVSGLALGIDTEAHRAALQRDGHTLAVLGAGLDFDYPARNRALRREIEKRGTVVTEYPTGTEPRPQYFPARNRIIAGLCEGVVVVEGNHKSGALITARLALDANRNVWAVPGSVRNPKAAGPNELIRTANAALITEVKHIFQEVSPSLVWSEAPRGESAPHLERDEAVVLSVLDDQPVSPDEITAHTKLSLGAVGLTLARLEVRGFINGTPVGYVLTTAGARARTSSVEGEFEEKRGKDAVAGAASAS